MTPRSGKFDLTSEYLRQKYQIDGQYKKFKRSVTPGINAQKVLPKTRSQNLLKFKEKESPYYKSMAMIKPNEP